MTPPDSAAVALALALVAPLQRALVLALALAAAAAAAAAEEEEAAAVAVAAAWQARPEHCSERPAPQSRSRCLATCHPARRRAASAADWR